MHSVSEKFANFTFVSQWLARHFGKQKRYAYLVIGNLRNFRFDARDSIVFLTHIAWVAIVTSASWAFSGPPIRRGIVSSRFLL